ncbi:GntR family transcriptional regulator [Roseomonas sp. NAR14]|uniref:GntR family transcriptional regulator n=1 Tax=Roseomonas acroporae TaxID=2937791 RepID=A0A9X2BT00_9PROT|nr:GntR family transcriptional regulator [Roseomonas acroporae]MCK8784093.1 GntR family transcriptional regulator [Roseomonas acroporae]
MSASMCALTGAGKGKYKFLAVIEHPAGADAPGLPAEAATAVPPDLTLAESAARRLRRDILAGSLPPAARLRLRDLSAQYGLGATPLREALSRLAAEGLVTLEGQKGFSVPPVTRAHLLDITRSRQVAEPEALRLAMAEGGAAWEDGIVATLSLLRHEVGRRAPESTAWLDRYEARHHAFHRALIAGCGLPSLRRFCDDLYVQKTRYRRVTGSAYADWPAVQAAHEGLAAAALARDPGAPALLSRHIGTTADQLLALLGEAPLPPARA